MSKRRAGKIRIVAVAALLASAMFGASSAMADRSVAVALRDNVVSIEAMWPGGTPRRGFGWIVGAREDSVYVVTADHVVRGDLPGEAALQPTIAFFADSGPPGVGELLPQHDLDLDLAIIRVPMPNRRLWRLASMGTESASAGDPVYFVGKKGNWFIPEQPGRIGSADGSRIVANELPVQVGTSGAPLIGAGGILGMIVSDSGEKVRAVSVAAIRERAESWAPWSIGAYEPPVDVAGKWGWAGPFMLIARFEYRDAAHVLFSLGPLANPREIEGTGVVDGKEIRIWNHNSMGADSWGVLNVIHEDAGRTPPFPLIIEGRVIAKNGKPTFGRIARLAPDGKVDARARAYMQQNPIHIETFAEQLRDRNERGGDQGSLRFTDRIDAAAAAPPTRTQPPSPINAAHLNLENVFLARVQASLGALGMNDVQLSIAEPCMRAVGSVPSAWHKEQLGEALDGLAEGFNRADRQLHACDDTIVR